MEILRVLNNNAVLCTENTHGQAICMGKGIGFGKKLGDSIDADRVEQFFHPSPIHPIGNLTALLSEVPLEYVSLASTLASRCETLEEPQLLILGLADHISFAVERTRSGTSIEYPLVWEVSTLYPEEFSLGLHALDSIEKMTGVRLDRDEAAAIAMHFINAQFVNGKIGRTEFATKEISNVVLLVSHELGHELNPGEATVARFITHLRYLFVRLYSPSSSTEAPLHSILSALETDDPEAVKVARKVSEHLEKTGHRISQNELSYIALHVARLRATLPT